VALTGSRKERADWTENTKGVVLVMHVQTKLCSVTGNQGGIKKIKLKRRIEEESIETVKSGSVVKQQTSLGGYVCGSAGAIGLTQGVRR